MLVCALFPVRISHAQAKVTSIAPTMPCLGTTHFPCCLTIKAEFRAVINPAVALNTFSTDGRGAVLPTYLRYQEFFMFSRSFVRQVITE